MTDEPRMASIERRIEKLEAATEHVGEQATGMASDIRVIRLQQTTLEKDVGAINGNLNKLLWLFISGFVTAVFGALALSGMLAS